MVQRFFPSLAAVACAAVLLNSAAVSFAEPANDLGQKKPAATQSVKGGESGGEEGCCDQCGGQRGRGAQGARGSAADNRAANFNCNCNGSYKFPVPPLSTYHWPGMYSIQLMTDYHSPWRFPPLRPYTEEPPYNGPGRNVSHWEVEGVSYEVQAPAASRGIEPLSAKIERLYGTK